MIVPDLNLKEIWKGLRKRVLSTSKKKKIISFVVAVLLALLSFVFYAFDVWAYIKGNTDAENLLGAVWASQDSINGQVKESEANLQKSIEDSDGISCRSLEGGDWVIDEAVTTNKQLVFLKDGETAGSIRLFGSFMDTFILKFVFIPAAIEGTNTTFSVKDEQQNELSVSFGDNTEPGSSILGLNYYEVQLKKQGVKVNLGNLDGPQKIVPSIKDSTEVTFQLETNQKANDISANAFILYAPSRKPSEIAKLDLFQDNMPYFHERKVRLHLGLRRTIPEQEPAVTIIDCEIKEKNI